MYTVMIVDDDLPVLEFLSSAIKWEELGFRLTGAFENPLEALEAGRRAKTDVLISDIGMPEMNGLDLIRSLREGDPHVKAVILSCHDDFHYAQKAMKLSVSEYILKETMNISNISEVLGRLKEQLDAEDHVLSKSRKLEKEAALHRSSSKRHFIRSTVNEPLFDSEEWSQQAEGFGLRLGQHGVLPVFGYANRVKEANQRFQSKDLFDYTIQNIIEELLVDQKEVTLFTYDTGEIVLLFPQYGSMHVNNGQKVEQTLRHLQSCLQQYAKVAFSFITGSPAKDVRSLKEQLKRMVEGRSSRFYLPESSVMKLEHVREGFGDGGLLLAEYAQTLDEFRSVVFDERSDLIDLYVSKWIDFIGYHRFHPMEVKEWLLKMILDVRMRLKSLQHYQSTFSSELLHHDVHELSSVRELELWLKDYLQQAIQWAGQVYRESHNREILECQRFVYNHLHMKISLEDAAAHLHLHPSYLSRLFKKETGENFVEYVTRMKMEKAKELLEITDKTVEQIADMLGYENKNYFGKLFKAHTGTVPNAFRGQTKGAQPTS
ncbi:helix-turn-helix domain-containing protein [Paenibacillus chondroitinus]|uniref:Helix-turn-helix domain-containing protein n=1 Tax=Paenibacillus chondroitinus TaxID=59842 RepID=A0ABU6DL92_9BACL|nr:MULTISPECIES: helix-turn-helix domain-containing protein [Paenibacillus]MCY9661370.1 helix-turn-helix domain-containing protein [Paenibacillus anseongense]MEB4798553.1 helix-turn-helix domain-containing protein [Paenibacillus chondroitinus]